MSSNNTTSTTAAATNNRNDYKVHNLNRNNSITGLASTYDTTREQTRITTFDNIDTINLGIDTVDDIKVYLGVNTNNKLA